MFEPDQVVSGRYRVLRKLGGGGMADVYLCEDLTLGRRVALKVLLQRFLSDPTFVERFRREAKAAGGLNHPNLVSIYDWGEVDGTYYIVMEYLEGETLKDLIRRQGRLSGNDAVHIALQLLAAIEFAHRAGIVHRDIKPQNVMLDRDGNVKVMDFGIARAGDSGMTEAGSILGTAQYLAPEQARGLPVDERSDLYSVGIVLYEMLTGTVPFKGDSAVTVALKHVNEMAPEPAQLVPGMPHSLNQIVMKSIAKDPDLRYQSAGQFTRDLRSALQGGPVAATTFDTGTEATRLMTAGAAGATSVMSGGGYGQERRPPRRRWPWIVAIVILLLVIAGAAYGIVNLMGGGGGDPVPSVVGKTQGEAIAALEEAGFKANVQEEFSDEVDEGIVSRQAPTGGTELAAGETVDIWVSKGAETVALEDFRGWSPDEVADVAQGERAARRAEVGQVGEGARRPGVQAGPRRPAPRCKKGDPGDLLGEQRQAAGHRTRPERHDPGRRADGAHRRQAHAGQRDDRAQHRRGRRRDRPPGPDGRHQGRAGHRREHRGVVRLTDAERLADAEPERRHRAQRVRHGLHLRDRRAAAGGVRCVHQAARRHRPAVGDGGDDDARRRQRGSGGHDGGAHDRQVTAAARLAGRGGGADVRRGGGPKGLPPRRTYGHSAVSQTQPQDWNSGIRKYSTKPAVAIHSIQLTSRDLPCTTRISVYEMKPKPMPFVML